jgi:hypothetical protein
MATAIHQEDLGSTRGAPCAWPAFESLDETVRTAKRAVTDARYATEDFAAKVSLGVRRHPLASVGAAATAGVVAGAMAALAASWIFKHRE